MKVMRTAALTARRASVPDEGSLPASVCCAPYPRSLRRAEVVANKSLCVRVESEGGAVREIPVAQLSSVDFRLPGFVP